MSKKSTTRKKVVNIHWTWVFLAVMAISIPLTVLVTSQQTNIRQEAKGHDNNKGSTNNG